MVEELLASVRVGISDLSAIAVGIGPGSFTGLRIALSYAKGVAFAAGCKIVGVPTLDAMAVAVINSPSATPVAQLCPILDARRGQLYGALYETTPAALHKLTAEFVLNPEDLAATLTANTLFFGEGLSAHRQRLGDAMGPRAVFLEHNENGSTAIAIAALGAQRLAAGEADDAASLQPRYVRPPEAVLKMSQTKGNGLPTEAIWSGEKKISSFSTLLTTKS